VNNPDGAQERSQQPPNRIAPADATDDAVERLVGRRRVLEPKAGDVVVIREKMPALKPMAGGRWRYRLVVHPQAEGHTFDSFQTAASHGEALAHERRARVIYIEDGIVSVLSDHAG
jgi:hypothetical protein